MRPRARRAEREDQRDEGRDVVDPPEHETLDARDAVRRELDGDPRRLRRERRPHSVPRTSRITASPNRPEPEVDPRIAEGPITTLYRQIAKPACARRRAEQRWSRNEGRFDGRSCNRCQPSATSTVAIETPSQDHLPIPPDRPDGTRIPVRSTMHILPRMRLTLATLAVLVVVPVPGATVSPSAATANRVSRRRCL
jgi:hypothetical protein